MPDVTRLSDFAACGKDRTAHVAVASLVTSFSSSKRLPTSR
jgi:hypothetical protein